MATITDYNATTAALPQEVGDEFLVGTPQDWLSIQDWYSVTGLTNGGFVVSATLRSGGVSVQVFDATGALIGDADVNTTWLGYQGFSTITGLSNGGFVVTWADGDIKAQLFDATGAKVGGEFFINTTTEGGQNIPAVTSLTDGGFVVSWVDGSGLGGDSSSASIKAQVFDAIGTKVGSEFLVNTKTEGLQNVSTITGLSNGGFVVTWSDRSFDEASDTFPQVLRAQVFDATGTKVGSEFLVNTPGGASAPTITDLSDGGFAIAWAHSVQGFEIATWANSIQVFDATGTKVGSEALVYSSGGILVLSDLPDGGFVAAWVDRPYPFNVGNEIKAQVFDAIGTKVGSEFFVNNNSAGSQAIPLVTGLTGGRFIITWVEDDTSIKAQIFGTNSNAPVITTAAIQTIAEDTQFVAALTSTDVDVVGASSATFSITGGADAALFEVLTAADGSQSLRFVTAPDYETNPHSYHVEVSANDGSNTTAKLITVNLADVNENPTAVALANTLASIAENTSTASHIKVADITTTDDALGTNTLALTGTDATFFEIVGTELFLKSGTSLDFESKASYAVAVTVDDPTVGATPDATSTTYTLAIANVSGVTINGTSGNDTINATTTVAGQPLPTNENDTIKGGAGNDTINGLGGNDLLAGGGGSNKFVFSGPSFGKDTVIDFQATGSKHDVLQFDHSIFTSAADVLANAVQVGKDVVITYDAADTVTLVGVHLNQLTAQDLLIV